MTEENNIPDIKVILLGESAVGKTSIIRRFYDETFDLKETSTVSMSYVDKIVEIDGKKYKLIIWDTVGQESYRTMTQLFLNNSKIVILVYSIDNKNSFTNLNFWYELYEKELSNEAILGIIGNKSDLLDDTEVTFQEGSDFAKSKGAIFSELSSLIVILLFKTLIFPLFKFSLLTTFFFKVFS
jgi:small GTP-binding protein